MNNDKPSLTEEQIKKLIMPFFDIISETTAEQRKYWPVKKREELFLNFWSRAYECWWHAQSTISDIELTLRPENFKDDTITVVVTSKIPVTP